MAEVRPVLPTCNAQRGNMLVIILMGVMLFAAVSAAIMNTSGSSKSIKSERAGMRAQQILRYGEQLKTSVDQLYKNGISESSIRFSNPALNSTYGDMANTQDAQVFVDSGGGLPYVPPPPEAVTDTANNNWEFYGTSDIPQVGTSAPDLIAVVPNVKEAVCKKINEMLGYPDKGAVIPTDDSSDNKCVYSSANGDRFVGAFKTGGDINTVGTTGFSVLPAYQACVSCSGTYHYYKVLLER